MAMHRAPLSLLDSLRLLALASLALFSAQVAASGVEHDSHVIVKRHAGLAKRQNNFPDGWVEVGCYSDAGDRTFPGAHAANDTMTRGSCVAFCSAGGFSYAGLSYGYECFCDNAVRGTGAPVNDGCTMPCAGNDKETCGGGWRLNVFRNTKAPVPVTPAPLATYGDWKSIGCHVDDGGARLLTRQVHVEGAFTTEKCLDECTKLNFAFAGTEYSNECYCGTVTEQKMESAKANNGCTMTCDGNKGQLCGGPNRLNVYQTSAVASTPNPTPNDVAGWKQVGCYLDNEDKRSLDEAGTGNAAMTPEVCTAFCAQNKYQYAGVESGNECYCGNKLGGTLDNGKCTTPCAGKPTATCGGNNHLSVYQVISGPAPPAGWVDSGCYVDNAARVLNGAVTAAGDMTPGKCSAFCQNAGFKIAGTQYSTECYCGNSLADVPKATEGCNMPCAGDAQFMCGGPYRLNVLTQDGNNNGPTPPPPVLGDTDDIDPIDGPRTLMTYGNWRSSGCHPDNVGGRVMPIGMGVAGEMTVEKCLDACFKAGHKFAGLEYSAECYCADAKPTVAPVATGCIMPCAGNEKHLCGGPDRLNVYEYQGGDLPPPIDNGGGDGGDGDGGNGGNGDGGNGGGGGEATLPANWHYDGCWVDGQFGRILPVQRPDDPDMTVEKCVASCAGAGYALAGLQYSVQCFCGNQVQYAGTRAAQANQCNMPCGGNPEQMCGAGNRLSIYTTQQTITVIPVPTAKTQGLPGNWQYDACYAEANPGTQRVFTQQAIMETDMTSDKCLNLCHQFGYNTAAFQFGKECYCGDATDLEARSAGKQPEADCSFACVAEPGAICGGALRLSVYHWNGAGGTVWANPENKGRYELLTRAPIVGLHVTLGLNNKVTFLERRSGQPTGSNSATHAYELDLSLLPAQNAWREMKFGTDVFCAAGLVLPDKAGRQVNIAGWALDDTYGVRFYTPEGAPGVQGTNDWEENQATVRLQRGRWYPSAMQLTNGSILVIGGQTGANGPPEPTIEILPRPPGGPTFLEMDWLRRTDPFNLYPFTYVLPSGGIFVQYSNEGRILDPVTFATRGPQLDLPGSMSVRGGRSYPYAGTGVMLPLKAPYTDPATVMVCGGSSGNHIAFDNCVSVQPDVSMDAKDVIIERMPFPRVMSNIAGLPDGTFLIVNGAKQGEAGFGLAIDPTLTAVLYDPEKPLHQRFSILGTTTIARMYHSESILLPDGRVMISGSDPLDVRFPEEFRVEVYLPPYLTANLPRPTYTITNGNKDWAYGGRYTFTLTSALQGTIRVSLVAADSSSHGVNWGQRTIFPEVTCNGNTCTVVAPPNGNICPPGWFQMFVLDVTANYKMPSLSQWVRIGGDPAGLGNWPANDPAFKLPGV
ncbi:hypothetical protein HGRIS_004722 [Hohenbuehelia grisea]|uniref:WSC domain-containing protein n=1 Tax=Hohenbuehelia grisea TaxID=104357 RepID=A0ABR3JDE3_9AGAR